MPLSTFALSSLDGLGGEGSVHPLPVDEAPFAALPFDLTSIFEDEPVIAAALGVPKGDPASRVGPGVDVGRAGVYAAGVVAVENTDESLLRAGESDLSEPEAE